jgi:hypothetical protein
MLRWECYSFVTPLTAQKSPFGLGPIQELTDLDSTQKITGWADWIRPNGYYYGNN